MIFTEYKVKCSIIRKNLKGRKQTNKYGRGTEWHLPKTDESVVRPAGIGFRVDERIAIWSAI